MTDRYCPNCGTEVDADARFCPTCGQTLDDDAARFVTADDDQPTAQIPPAPEWPAPAPSPASPPPAAPPPEAATGEAAPERADSPPPAAPPSPTAAPGRATPGSPEPAGGDLPITLPTMLSGWLIGSGSGLAAIALLPRLANILNLLLFLALLGITASVFLADRLPRFAYLRLTTLVVVMVALGVALDRSAFTVRGIDTVFLITMLVAAGGVLLVELDRDRPMPPAGGQG